MLAKSSTAPKPKQVPAHMPVHGPKVLAAFVKEGQM
jgi:hypothetical protein